MLSSYYVHEIMSMSMKLIKPPATPLPEAIYLLMSYFRRRHNSASECIFLYSPAINVTKPSIVAR